MSVRLAKRLDLSWILVVLLTVFAVAPLTYPGFFEAHTGFLPALNVEHLAAAPNWARDLSPIRDEGKLPYLLAQPFFALSGSGSVAVKWGYGLAFVLGALGVYAWTRTWLGRRGAVLASAVYTYLPWHLGTVYVRGAYGEAWLWAIWPIVLWAIDRWNRERGGVAVVVGLIALVAGFLSQAGLFALSVPFLAAYLAVTDSHRRWPVARFFGAVLLPVGLLWIAGLFLPSQAAAFQDRFLYPFQLLSAAWGDGLSFQLGLAAIGLSIVAVALQINANGAPRPHASDQGPAARRAGRVFWFWIVVLLAVILLTLPVSSFLWKISGLDTYLTAPWQLLALVGLPLAFLSGAVVRLEKQLATLPAWAGLIALVVLASYPYLAPRFTQVDPGPEPVAMFQPEDSAAPQLMILDYEVQPPTEITSTVVLTLTWQAVQPVDEDYTVFVHALGEGEAKAAQRDTRPCDGECPTSDWQPGEIVIDSYRLDLAPDAPPGPYQMAVGLYLLETGERLGIVGQPDGTVYLDVP